MAVSRKPNDGCCGFFIGQMFKSTDPVSAVAKTETDDAGRTTKAIHNFGGTTQGSGVGGAVRRIEHSFDNRMRLEKVTSYDATTSGSVESQIQYDYNDSGQLTKEYQQHGSVVNVSTSPVVEHNFENGGSNTIRMKSLTYPDGRQLDYEYGTSGSQTDRLDRVSTIEDGATTLVTYQHSGAGVLVTQTYNEPGIEKTLALGSGSDPYLALDRFGRMIDLRWKKGSTDLVRFEYDYDRVSNRLNERNLVTGTGGMNPAVDSLFEYDELNRLTEFKTGQLNPGGDMIAVPIKTNQDQSRRRCLTWMRPVTLPISLKSAWMRLLNLGHITKSMRSRTLLKRWEPLGQLRHMIPLET